MSRIFLERKRFIVDLPFTKAGALFYVGNTWQYLRKSFACEMPRKTMLRFCRKRYSANGLVACLSIQFKYTRLNLPSRTRSVSILLQNQIEFRDTEFLVLQCEINANLVFHVSEDGLEFEPSL